VQARVLWASTSKCTFVYGATIWFQRVAPLIALFCMLLQVLYTCPPKAPQANPS
jgi:hypothetical protein